MTIYTVKKLLKRYKIIVIFLMIILIIIFLTVVFIKPKVMNIIDLNNQNNQNSKLLNTLLKKKNYLETIDTKDIKNKFDLLSSAIPAEKDIPGYLLGIAKIANEASVSVGLIEINPGSLSTSSAVKKNITQTPVISKVSVKGNWQDIVKFITKAINGRRLLKVDGVDLSGVAAQKTNLPVSMTFLISLYSQSLPETLGNIDELVPGITDEEEILISKLKNFPLYSGIERQLSDMNSLSTNSGSTSAVMQGSVAVGKTDLFSR